MNLEEAYKYAIKNGPEEKTRKIACQNPHFAYLYALYIDKQSREDTRIAACETPGYAYCYAYDIDTQPKEDTRNIACRNPKYAYYYARDIDKCFHQKTYEATLNTKYEEDYKILMNNQMKEEII